MQRDEFIVTSFIPLYRIERTLSDRPEALTRFLATLSSGRLVLYIGIFCILRINIAIMDASQQCQRFTYPILSF